MPDICERECPNASLLGAPPHAHQQSRTHKPPKSRLPAPINGVRAMNLRRRVPPSRHLNTLNTRYSTRALLHSALRPSVGGVDNAPADAPGAGDGDAVVRIEARPELGELLVRDGVLREEGLLVRGEALGVRAEGGVLQQRAVRLQHQQLRVPRPLLRLHQALEVAVVKLEPLARPAHAPKSARAVLGVLRLRHGARAAAVLVRAPEGVGSAQRDDVHILQAHAIEDGAKMLGRRHVRKLRRIISNCLVERSGGTWQAAIGRHFGVGLRIHAPIYHVNLRSTGNVNGCGARHLKQVRVCHFRVPVLDGLEEGNSIRDTRVPVVTQFFLEPNGPIRTPSLGVDVVITAVVPRKAHQQRGAFLALHKLMTGTIRRPVQLPGRMTLSNLWGLDEATQVHLLSLNQPKDDEPKDHKIDAAADKQPRVLRQPHVRCWEI
mmetsp:Transcript_28733/g.62946  ORF Transcript_28733/g.62946 Transcript_28733/m.62946 type:complete len:434 (+) Transcript_28733:487-1788(+)